MPWLSGKDLAQTVRDGLKARLIQEGLRPRLAVLLALGMLGLMQVLAGEALDYFQFGMMLAAAALITQMVFWMRRHGRSLQSELHRGLERAVGRGNWWGVLLVVALAVGRESAETVVFLYGFGFESHSAAEWLAVVLLGVLLALRRAG